MKENTKSDGVTIGRVSGGITNSIIAGRDVRNATITVGGQLIAADKKPNIDELKQLLAEIQQEVAQLRVLAQKENAAYNGKMSVIFLHWQQPMLTCQSSSGLQ